MPNTVMCSVEPETHNQREFLAEPVASQHVIRRSVTVPKDEAHYCCTNAVPAPAAAPDYPTPCPVIANFDGDPFSYWSFMRSFDLHIAQRMPNESAKMVYLLQHCTPKIRQDLEHFSQDLEMGYKLARETLYREYGQPHVVAYCREKRLLNFPRLKPKDPVGLRNINVLMDKSLTMLQNIREFATLNSLGTIQKITEKLPDDMQRDWVKWSF